VTGAPAISFIVPVRDDAARLRRCLQSIATTGARVPCEVIVADNGSIDGSDDVARQAGARVVSLAGMRVAAMRNAAAAAASGDVLAFVDADHEIDAGWAVHALDVLRGPHAGAVGAPYEAPPDGTWVQRAYDRLRRRARRQSDVGWLGSGNIAVRRRVFDELQGFDTTLETCEDVDFCRRLRERGYRLIEDPRLRSIHHGDPASLKALFLGELWRGRDNLRASLRGEFRLRELPSLAIPVADLALLAAAAAGIATFSAAGLAASAAALTPIVGLSLLRASVMSRRRRPASVMGTLQSIPVALVYDVARALALVARGGHQARRRA
jgi:GT2 family glycosyltransferase